jgi:hypothetical protein
MIQGNFLMAGRGNDLGSGSIGVGFFVDAVGFFEDSMGVA